MSSEKIQEIEKLVNKMADSYDLPSQEEVAEMNCLIHQDWEAEDYWNYCCEYWSHHSLEETVWALMHDGRYPKKEEMKVCFWKTAQNVTISEQDIYESFRLGKEKKIKNQFEVLPVEEIFDYAVKLYQDWKVTEKDFVISEDDYSGCTFYPTKNQEYGVQEQLLFSSYGKRMISITFTNIVKENREKLIKYIVDQGIAIYYPD